MKNYHRFSTSNQSWLNFQHRSYNTRVSVPNGCLGIFKSDRKRPVQFFFCNILQFHFCISSTFFVVVSETFFLLFKNTCPRYPTLPNFLYASTRWTRECKFDMASSKRRFSPKTVLADFLNSGKKYSNETSSTSVHPRLPKLFINANFKVYV